MSSFTTDLITRVLDADAMRLDRLAGNTTIPDALYDGEHWQVMQEFDYFVGAKGSDEVVHVERCYITDGASVPRIFWNLLPPFGKYGKAAVIHDRLYSSLGLNGKYTRKQCDDILLEAMVVLQVGWLTRSLIYSGVRLGGWATWANYQRKKAAAASIAERQMP